MIVEELPLKIHKRDLQTKLEILNVNDIMVPPTMLIPYREARASLVTNLLEAWGSMPHSTVRSPLPSI